MIGVDAACSPETMYEGFKVGVSEIVPDYRDGWRCENKEQAKIINSVVSCDLENGSQNLQICELWTGEFYNNEDSYDI